MRYSLPFALALCLLAAPAFAQDDAPSTKKEAVEAPAAETVDPAKAKSDYSYAIGLQLGRGIKSDDIDVDLEQLFKGFTDAVKDAKPALTDAQLRTAMLGLQAQLQAKAEVKAKEMAAQAAVLGEKNKKAGEAYLAANKKKEGVVTLPSGLQYKVLKAGTGKSPKATDVVKTHYHGTLIDGKVFDSSVERGEPVSFPVNRVIPGWTEALQKMKVGDKWQLVIPSNLAYGERGAGEDIGPNATLVFDVELLDIEAPGAEK